MLYQQVDKTVNALFQEKVIGSFHFGLEPIKEFVFFYCMAIYIQSQNSKTMSIRQYADQTYEAKSSLNGDNHFGTDFERENDYEKTLDHFNNINVENKLRLLQRQYREKKRKKDMDDPPVNGNPKRYEGVPIKRYQLDEFAVLQRVKKSDFNYVKANTTQKRLVSEKGYLYRINFREYQDYVQVLKDDIEESDNAHNIQYYKLEKRLGFELYKSILSALHRCRQLEPFHAEEVVSDLMRIFHLPLITIRQGYAELYPELNVEEKVVWRMEVEGINRFLGYCILKLQGTAGMAYAKYIEKRDWYRFESLYWPDSFQNEYKMRKDFNAKDFLAVQKALDMNNTAVYHLMKKRLIQRYSGDSV